LLSGIGRDNQCSQPSSLSIFGVGRDGLRLIVRLFESARTGCRGLFLALGPPVLTQVETIHFRTNYSSIVRRHSCGPRQSPVVPYYFRSSNAVPQNVPLAQEQIASQPFLTTSSPMKNNRQKVNSDNFPPYKLRLERVASQNGLYKVRSF